MFLLALSDALGALTVSTEVAGLAAARLCERLGANRVYYGEIEGDLLKIEHDYTREVPSIVGEFSMEPFGPEFIAAYREGAIIRVDDAETDPKLTEAARSGLRDRQVGAFIDIGLFEDERQVALFAVQSAAPRTWTPGEEVLIREVAERVRSAIKRTLAEGALRVSEERLRQFGEASQDVLWIRDAENLQWQYLTPAFEAIYGLSREEALAGDNYRSWLDLIVPADRPGAIQNIERVRRNEHVAFEYRVRRPVDGTIRWLRNTDFPITDETGNVKLVGGIGHDLTELREAELRLHALVDGIPQLVWRAVDGGHWTWASPQWTTYTGQSEPDSRGWGWLAPLHPEDRELARGAWSRATDTGVFEVEYRVRHAPEDRYRWFQTRATPVHDQAGTIVEWLGTSTDVDELRAMQDRQQVMVAELQHRTRNLIAIVRSIAQQTIGSSEDLESFRDAFNERLAALSRVQGLLSRSEQERITIEALLRVELDALGARKMADRVNLSGPEVPLRNSIVQTMALALHELATNALKYGALAVGTGRLDVRWQVCTDARERPRLAFTWVETGVDMEREVQSPVSQPGGYGRELIERALPYALGAKTTYELSSDGVRCTIDLPLDRRITQQA